MLINSPWPKLNTHTHTCKRSHTGPAILRGRRPEGGAKARLHESALVLPVSQSFVRLFRHGSCLVSVFSLLLSRASALAIAFVLPLSIYLSISLSVSPHLCRYVCLSLSLLTLFSRSLSTHARIYLSISLSTHNTQNTHTHTTLTDTHTNTNTHTASVLSLRATNELILVCIYFVQVVCARHRQ
jgi:hypothetical protein